MAATRGNKMAKEGKLNKDNDDKDDEITFKKMMM